MESHSKRIAIVTGASSGIGREFARLLQNNCDEIWLVARRKDRLEELAKELGNAQVLDLDLTYSSCILKLIQKLQDESPMITHLINNAGFGLSGKFVSLSIDRQLQMIDLNIRALTELCYRCLPYLSEGSQIINVASSAAFVPLPNYAVYAASKSYVHSFSLALSTELKERKISVTSVCPGPVETEFFDVAAKGQRPSAALAAEPHQVAAHALKKSAAGDELAIYGMSLRVGLGLSRLLPSKWVRKISTSVMPKP